MSDKAFWVTIFAMACGTAMTLAVINDINQNPPALRPPTFQTTFQTPSLPSVFHEVLLKEKKKK